MELVNLGKQFWQTHREHWQHDFCDTGTWGGPDASGGLCTSSLREVEGQHARCHFESVKLLKGARAGRGPMHVQFSSVAQSCPTL